MWAELGYSRHRRTHEFTTEGVSRGGSRNFPKVGRARGFRERSPPKAEAKCEISTYKFLTFCCRNFGFDEREQYSSIRKISKTVTWCFEPRNFQLGTSVEGWGSRLFPGAPRPRQLIGAAGRNLSRARTVEF